MMQRETVRVPTKVDPELVFEKKELIWDALSRNIEEGGGKWDRKGEEEIKCCIFKKITIMGN